LLTDKQERTSETFHFIAGKSEFQEEVYEFVITIRYGAIASSHTLQFAMARTESSLSAVLNQSSGTGFQQFPNYPRATPTATLDSQ
jgi:hypothetical protein